MPKSHLTLMFVVALLTIAGAGSAAAHYAFASRIPLGISVGTLSLTGLPHDQLDPALAQYQQALTAQTVTIKLGDQAVTQTLGQLGISLDVAQTAARLRQTDWRTALTQAPTAPVFAIDSATLHGAIKAAFADAINPPRNASLAVTPANQLALEPSAAGDGVDMLSLEHELRWRLAHDAWDQPLELALTTTAPAVQDHEVEVARALGEELLRNGFVVTFGDQSWTMKNVTVRRLLTFIERPDPSNAANRILGVAFDEAKLREYLAQTLAPEINQPAINARFERQGDRVEQFAVPQEGRTLNEDETVKAVNGALLERQTTASLAVDVATPDITDTTDIEALGITTLLAAGESDFVGSPRNRQHNIAVGTSRYHGLLIPPGEEFSFLEYLGPVDASTGFKPELVIKENVTIPEFGGGLCQVSTTVFRAAVYSGLEVTERRNHSYAVRYYGTPGFDATIYPPYTDLRFTNNTPGYILIQARIEGTRLIFEFWGTDDGRTVEVAGPFPYDRQPDGAVKATLTQKVSRQGELLIDETFYSRYKSPDLFPKILAADDPESATQTPPHDPNPTSPAVSPSPAANPPAAAPSATPKPQAPAATS